MELYSDLLIFLFPKPRSVDGSHPRLRLEEGGEYLPGEWLGFLRPTQVSSGGYLVLLRLDTRARIITPFESSAGGGGGGGGRAPCENPHPHDTDDAKTRQTQESCRPLWISCRPSSLQNNRKRNQAKGAEGERTNGSGPGPAQLVNE